MCHISLAEATRNLRLLLTLTRTSQNSYPITSILTRTSTTSSSFDESVRGLGSDFGNFLYWLGECLLGAWGEVIIRGRLLSIRRAIQHKGIIERVDASEAGFVRRACEDLLDLCG